MTANEQIIEITPQARQAGRALATSDGATRTAAILAMAADVFVTTYKWVAAGDSPICGY
jgi:hypothetical protein